MATIDSVDGFSTFGPLEPDLGPLGRLPRRSTVFEEGGVARARHLGSSSQAKTSTSRFASRRARSQIASSVGCATAWIFWVGVGRLTV